MKIVHILAAAAFCMSLVPASRADLLVTEVNSSASGGDFWELTNFGPTTVNLFDGATPWSWSDNANTPGLITMPLGISIAAGESILFLHDITTTSTTAFRTAWNLSASVQIVAVVNPVGLGSGDAVNLFNGAGTTVASLNYAASGFTRSNGTASIGGHAGLSAGGSSNTQSLIWDPTSGTTAATARYTFADGTNFGSYDAPGSTGFGSPGFTAVPEPTTTAIGFAVVTALFVFFRRRKSARA